jgi:S-adenosylmethionine hydrolase
MSIITLTTDFGTRDGFVGVMKGVILGIAPDVTLVDISHGIGPQNVREASFILARHVEFFPAGTIHVVVVDPGVGTERRPIAAQIGDQRFVAPDNGVLSPIYERAELLAQPAKTVHTNNPKYWLGTVSNVFHGRDIFAPVAAHWAAGVKLEQLGDEITDPVRFESHKPRKVANGLFGQIAHIDQFGNLISNIHRKDLGEAEVARVEVYGEKVEGLVRTFGEREPGSLIALFSSNDFLTVSVVNGNAAEELDAATGDPFEVEFK